MKIFGGGKILLISFFSGGGGGHQQNWIILEIILCILGSFLKVKVQNGNVLGGNIFRSIFDIPDILGQ